MGAVAIARRIRPGESHWSVRGLGKHLGISHTSVQRIWHAHGLKPHKVKEVLLWAADDVNYLSDITDTFDLKIAALRCHQSQVGHFSSTDLENGLREQHKRLAEGQTFKLAEAFHRVEMFC